VDAIANSVKSFDEAAPVFEFVDLINNNQWASRKKTLTQIL
jgi:hypothetical protein